MNQKQIYELMLAECAPTAANRGVEGIATAEKILDVMREYHADELPAKAYNEKLAQKAADVYNRAMDRVAKMYAS